MSRSSVCTCRYSRRFVSDITLSPFSIWTSSPTTRSWASHCTATATIFFKTLAVGNQLHYLFNADQHQVFDKVVNAVLLGVSTEALDCILGPVLAALHRLFFLDAPGATRMTFLIMAIQRFLKSHDVHIVAVASSAVAAQLLDDRRTAHSACKIPILVNSDCTCHIDADSQQAQELRRTKLIIWNEIFMTHRHNLDSINCTLRDILWSILPFAGIVMLCIGYFRQILAVLSADNRFQIVCTCLKRSRLFPLFKRLEIHKKACYYKLFVTTRMQPPTHLSFLHIFWKLKKESVIQTISSQFHFHDL